MKSLVEPPDRFWTPLRATAANLAQIAVWFALAVWRLPGGAHFHYDEAFFYDRALAVARSGIPAADGPFISGTEPRAFIPGGAFFDLVAPAFVFTRNPFWGTIWIVFLSCAGLFLLDRALARWGVTHRMRVLAVTIATWTIWHARFSDRIWNVDAFLFLTPLLFWLSVRGARKWPWAIAWGLTAAAIVQVHLMGAVAVAMCALIARPHPLAAAGVLIAYLPWLLGHPSLAPLLAARSHHVGIAVGRAFAAFPKFIAPDGGLFPALALTLLGIAVRGPWRWPCVAGFLLLPALLALSGRDYYDHYVISPFPFFALPAAAALSWLSGRFAIPVAVFAWAFAAWGAISILRQYGDNPWNLEAQTAIARQLADHGTYSADPASPLAQESLVYELLAKDWLQRPLRFDPGEDVSCSLTAAAKVSCRGDAF